MPPKHLQIRNSTAVFSVSKDSLVTDIKEITGRFNYRGILGSYHQWINKNFQILAKYGFVNIKMYTLVKLLYTK